MALGPAVLRLATDERIARPGRRHRHRRHRRAKPAGTGPLALVAARSRRTASQACRRKSGRAGYRLRRILRGRSRRGRRSGGGAGRKWPCGAAGTERTDPTQRPVAGNPADPDAGGRRRWSGACRCGTGPGRHRPLRVSEGRPGIAALADTDAGAAGIGRSRRRRGAPRYAGRDGRSSLPLHLAARLPHPDPLFRPAGSFSAYFLYRRVAGRSRTGRLPRPLRTGRRDRGRSWRRAAHPGLGPEPAHVRGGIQRPRARHPAARLGDPAAGTGLVHPADPDPGAVVGRLVRDGAFTLDAAAGRFVAGLDRGRRPGSAARRAALVSAGAGPVGADSELPDLELAWPATGGTIPVRGTGAGPGHLALHRRRRHHHRRRRRGGISESDRRNPARPLARPGAGPPAGRHLPPSRRTAEQDRGRSCRPMPGNGTHGQTARTRPPGRTRRA